MWFHDLLLYFWYYIPPETCGFFQFYISGVIILLSLSGKFGAFFASIPLPIFAAIYCVLFGIVGRCCCYPYINYNNFYQWMQAFYFIIDFFCSCCWDFFYTVCKYQLHKKHLCSGPILVSSDINSTIFCH